MIKNPILRGFYPDPSICRVEDDFYIVTSSFSYFPGVPIFHSKDLANWEQIGHVLDRQEQLHVTYEDISLGIFAPTIRYHKGIFYMITTNMTTHENFFCIAKNPAGPWSNPIIVDGAGGIDPDLFFDEDEKVYYIGTSPYGDARFEKQCIVCSEIYLETGQLIGEMWSIGDGHAKNAYSPEAPHIYKKDGWYYLMIAEGGTEHYRAITISRSRSLREPFEQYQGNPILTHRHLGMNAPICNVGHGDLFELKDGSWYMVCLGSRLINGYHKLLGRETFIVPVEWQDGWPIACPNIGEIEWEYPAPKDIGNNVECQNLNESKNMGFGVDKIGLEWNYLGTPYSDFATIKDGILTLQMKKTNTVPWEFEGKNYDFMGHMMSIGKTKENVSFLGRRVQEADFKAVVTLKVDPKDKESAGMVLLQNNANQIRIEVEKLLSGSKRIFVTKTKYQLQNGKMHYDEIFIGDAIVDTFVNEFTLKVIGRQNEYDFYLEKDGNEIDVAKNVDGRHLGSEVAGGFVGAYIGVFASGNGHESTNTAIFTSFSMEYDKENI